MSDNRVMYGVRWSVAANGGRACPTGIECFVENAQSFDVNGGAANVAIGPGDLVSREASGGMILTDGKETTPTDPYGVVIKVEPYWDGSKMVFGTTLPSDTTYGTVLERQSKLIVVPITAGVWEIDCDAKHSTATLAGYQLLIGNNCEFINSDYSLNGTARPAPELDISEVATTALGFRIVGISKTMHNQDFTGDNVKLLVEANTAQAPWTSTTGV